MINNRTLYAIKALCELATRDGFSSTSESIAEAQNIPKKFLPQILSDLARIGLLRSTRGYGGGVSLIRKPDRINLLEVIEGIQGNLFSFGPFSTRKVRQQGVEDKLVSVFESMQKAMKAELSRVSLDDLVSRSRLRKKTRGAKK